MNRLSNKILITGATGTVGSELVKQLSSSALSSNIYIKAAIHSKKKEGKLNSYKGLEIIGLDYKSPKTLANAFKDIDKLFLLTIPNPNRSDDFVNIIKEAKNNRIKYIVKLSAEVADVGPETIFGKQHRQEEKIIEESGIPYTFLRPSGFMQNFVNYYGHTIKTQNAFYLSAGNGQMSFVDVRDIVSIAVKALLLLPSDINNDESNWQLYKNKSFYISGKEALSYYQAAEVLSKTIGRKISYVDITEEEARKGMEELGMEDWFIDAMIELNNIIKHGYASQTTDVIEKITGREPITFEQFVRDHVNFFK